MDKRVVLFVDGENFRKTICALFPPPRFTNEDYLPLANWSKFFESIAREAIEKMGYEYCDFIRCYWYVVGEFNYAKYFQSKIFQNLPLEDRLEFYKKNASSVLGDEKSDKSTAADRCNKHLTQQCTWLQKRTEGWLSIQKTIQKNNQKVEFRRFGQIFVHLDKMKFGAEKGTDVKMAVDIQLTSPFYDVAVIVSGDADYIPAIQAIKNIGKHAVNVDFNNEKGELLPGGARGLREHCDATLTLGYKKMKKEMNISKN